MGDREKNKGDDSFSRIGGSNIEIKFAALEGLIRE